MPSFLPTVHRFHESAWLVQFHTGFDTVANRRVHQLSRHFLGSKYTFDQVIPAYDSLYIEFSPTFILKQGADRLDAFIKEQVQTFFQAFGDELHTQTDAVAVVTIPVCYDDRLGNDLDDMCASLNLSKDEIIALHSSRLYQVYMLGFLPGFPYMGEVDERIAFPRKSKPQTVKAGAVGIAGQQTGIYPSISPGGWNIVGHTPIDLFDANAVMPTLLQPGQFVQFTPVDLHTYKTWPTV